MVHHVAKKNKPGSKVADVVATTNDSSTKLRMLSRQTGLRVLRKCNRVNGLLHERSLELEPNPGSLDKLAT